MIFRYVFFIGWLLSTCLEASDGEKIELHNAVKKAEKYLSDKFVIAEIGSLFLKQKLTPELFDDKDVPKDDAFARLFGAHHSVPHLSLTRTIENKGILRGIPALRPLNNYFYILPQNYRAKILDPWDDVLIKTLYCDVSGFDDLDYAILNAIYDGQGGYYDTHQLLGLFMLEENDCYDKEKIQDKKSNLVENIVTSLNNDDIFSDLYAERVACLYWAGAGNRVKPEWIRRIKDAQRMDGGWADIGLDHSGSHPTGLAAISIKYFLEQDSDEKPSFYKR